MSGSATKVVPLALPACYKINCTVLPMIHTFLFVYTDFSQQLSEFDSRSGLPPSSLCWCGVDAVALRWEGLLLLVGPYGDWLKRACEGPHVMVPEVDGLRLITGTTMSLLRRVPDVLVQVSDSAGCCNNTWAVCLYFWRQRCCTSTDVQSRVLVVMQPCGEFLNF